MNHVALTAVLIPFATWVVAHLLYLGPVETATQIAVTWITGIVGASVVIAALTVLVWGVVVGQTSPAWLRFLHQARSVAVTLGGILMIIGLLRWRDTEPRSELHWLVVGVAVLAGAMLVQAWLVLAERRKTT